MGRKKKVKQVQLIDWYYTDKLDCRKSNKDITFNYQIPTNIKVESISASAWIYTDNPDDYKVNIKAMIYLDNELLIESEVAETSRGTAWASCSHTFDDLCESGLITIKTKGSLFKKGLTVTLKGYEVIDG